MGKTPDTTEAAQPASSTSSLSSTPTPILWVRAPLQARSQATLERLLDACEALLEEMPFDEIGVAALCKKGRSSVGAFYTRFPDKMALLHLLHERVCLQSKATAEQALAPARWEGQALRDVVTALVVFTVQAYRGHKGLRREIVRQNAADAAFRNRSRDVAAFTVERLRDHLDGRRAEHRHDDVTIAADFVHRLIFAALDQHAVFDDNPAGVLVDDEVFSRELVRAVCGYLGVGAAYSASHIG